MNILNLIVQASRSSLRFSLGATFVEPDDAKCNYIVVQNGLAEESYPKPSNKYCSTLCSEVTYLIITIYLKCLNMAQRSSKAREHVPTALRSTLEVQRMSDYRWGMRV